MTPEQRERNNRIKWRLISQRVLREALAQEDTIIPGNWNHKARVDLARTAYEAGLRDGAKSR